LETRVVNFIAIRSMCNDFSGENTVVLAEDWFGQKHPFAFVPTFHFCDSHYLVVHTTSSKADPSQNPPVGLPTGASAKVGGGGEN
jgi:hypothetical protein